MGKLKSPLPSKYKYRYEQILNLIAQSGEIPTDLYQYIGIKHDTFRQALSTLKRKGYITLKNDDKLKGYVLQTKGKEYLRENSRLYSNGQPIQQRVSDVKKRRRNHMFGILYATFDRIGIEYQTEARNKRKNHSETSEEVLFFSAGSYKTEWQERGATFKGSRCYGFLVGKGHVYPVYATNNALPEFTKAEAALVNQLSKDYREGEKIKHAILFCRDTESVKRIIGQLYDFEHSGKGENLLRSEYFDDIYVVPMNNCFEKSIKAIYHFDRLKSLVFDKLKIKPEYDSKMTDGYINETEGVIFLPTLSIAKLKPFISSNREKNKERTHQEHIVCYDFNVSAVKEHIKNDNNIRIISIKTEEGSRAKD